MHFLFAMGAQDGSGGGASLVSTLIMFGAIALIFYFMIIRPQQKRQKEREKLINSIQKGDKIVTTNGFHGTIAGFDEKDGTIIVQFSDTVKIRVEKAAIGTVVTKDSPEIKEKN